MRIITLIIFSLFALISKAQFNPILDQYMFNGISLNPAVTGAENAFSLVGSYRAQWVGVDGAPQTQSITAHAPLKKTNLGLGLQIFADQIGVTRNTGIFASFAYRLKFEKSDLRFGLNTGINMIRNGYSSLAVNDQNDNLLINDTPRGLLPDAGFGAYWHSKKFFAGFSIPFFLTHSLSGNRFLTSNEFKNYNFNFNAGTIFKINENFNLRPSFLLKYRIDHRPQLDINFMTEYKEKMQFGLSYRTEEAIVALFKYSITKQFSFMYSFGMPISQIAIKTFGSHEISLKYNFYYKTTIQNPRQLL
jgi:type IX secretion system PorP/SprF family membrane protein